MNGRGFLFWREAGHDGGDDDIARIDDLVLRHAVEDQRRAGLVDLERDVVSWDDLDRLVDDVDHHTDGPVETVVGRTKRSTPTARTSGSEAG